MGYAESSDFLVFCIQVSIGMVFLTILVTVAYYCNARLRFATDQSTRIARSVVISDSVSVTIELGCDEATLGNFPKLLYSQSKLRKTDSTATICCSICLADYKDRDMLRVLPDCCHIFHINCIDPWLRLHPTCPLCRNAPVPAPFTSHLAAMAHQLGVQPG